MRPALALLLIGCVGSAAWACGRTGLPEFDGPGGRYPTPIVHFPTATGTPGNPLTDEGDGRDGPLVVTAGNTESPNECQLVAGTSGGDLLLVDPGSIQNGTRLFVQQVIGAQVSTSGNQAPIVAASIGTAGTWQVVQVVGAPTIDAGGYRTVIEPAAAIEYRSDASGRRAQACVLPQYTNVTIEAGATIEASTWDTAQKGGVVGFYANGLVTLEGTISAAEMGFRGGSTRGNVDVENIVVNDTNNSGDGGGKGEGIGDSWSMSGKGNIANGGGGGNGRNAGGGGGGNGGMGGVGGFQDGDVVASTAQDDATRGLGGAAIDVPAASRIVFGGGGGAGQQNNDSGGDGGAGGGAVLLFLNRIAGNGVVTANGENGGDSNGTPDGAGGGGAGGTILVRAKVDETGAGNWTVRAVGGGGGDSSSISARGFGPGGGGGGGRISATPAAAFTADVAGGGAGRLFDGALYGTSPGTNGVTE